MPLQELMSYAFDAKRDFCFCTVIFTHQNLLQPAASLFALCYRLLAFHVHSVLFVFLHLPFVTGNHLPVSTEEQYIRLMLIMEDC